MNRLNKSVRWLFYILLVCAIGVFALLLTALMPGISIGFAAPLDQASPTSTFALYDPSVSSTITLTPFQPLPTDTPTPTATNTPKPTATFTASPLPTSTPQPTNPPQPTIPPVDGIPSSAEISGLVGYAQNHNLSCEARSAVDWARYYGVSISEADFLAQLPISDNPEIGFVGDVDDPIGQIPPESYGVHASPVARVLRGYGLAATARKGYSFEELKRQIAGGNPVIVWVIGNVWSGYPVSYTTSEGETVTVAHNEHTAIVVGYDEYGVTLVDNQYVYWRSNSAFLGSWSVLGYMAITAD
ncbi:MAG: C39 family peptidase [Anaerolineaceae bacterium]|nr:C39 family peptidase [Anaerolineaceae bacterium]